MSQSIIKAQRCSRYGVVLGALLLLVSCTYTPKTMSVAELDTACDTIQNCAGLPPPCTDRHFPQEVFGPGTKEERAARIKEIAEKLKLYKAQAWAHAEPPIRFPVALLKAGGKEPARVLLRALVSDKGSLSKICYQSLTGNAAYARNAAYAMQSWIASDKLMSEIPFRPFVGEVEFIFTISE